MAFGRGQDRRESLGPCTGLTRQGVPCRNWATQELVWLDGAEVCIERFCARHAAWWERVQDQMTAGEPE